MQKIARSYGADLELIDVSKKISALNDKGLKKWGEGHGFSAYARFFIDELLPSELEWILYLDCDTIIEGPLRKIFRESVVSERRHAIYGCLDAVPSFHRKKINLKGDSPYINSGVLLIDMVRWRTSSCLKRIMDHVNRVRAYYPYVDQDIINVALKDELGVLPLEYNFHSYMGQFSPRNILRMMCAAKKEFYGEEEIKTAAEHPTVVHFTHNSYCRPWYGNGFDPYGSRWDAYLEKTPWRGYVKTNFKPSAARKVLLKTYEIFPENFYSLFIRTLKTLARI